MKQKKLTIDIGIDFDGTVVTHAYPRIGDDIGAIPVLKALVERGHRLILNTMRSGHELGDAIDWFKNNDINLYGIQINPDQATWTSSNKCYAQMYIDDAALGCPTMFNLMISNRHFVNWVEVKKMLINLTLLSDEPENQDTNI